MREGVIPAGVDCLFVQPAFGPSGGAYTPIGLALMASILKEAGHSAAILDARLSGFSAEEAAGVIAAARPRVAAFTSMTAMIPWVGRTSSLLKQSADETSIIVGGPHVTALPEETLSEFPAFDAVVLGEGEGVITPLVEAMLAGDEDLENVPGIAYRADGDVKVTERPPLVEDLSALPKPAYDLLPMKNYRTHRGKQYALMMASRGCPGRCKFCYRLTFGRKVRRRTVKHVVDEMELLEKEYGVEEISFEDDHFTTSRPWMGEFCEEVRRRKLKAEWTCWTRVDGVNEALLSDMKASGCRLIRYGVESGSQEILDRSGKGTKVEKAVEAFRLTRRAGVETWGFFMIGNMGETERTAEDTIRLARGLAPDVFQFAMATPYPGTELREWAEKRGYILAEGWEDYAETGARAVMRTEALSGEEIASLRRKANIAARMSPRWLARRLVHEITHPREVLGDVARLIRLLTSGRT